MAEARWVDRVAHAKPEWPMVQVAFCDLVASDREDQLDQFQALASVVGVRQIVGRSPEEDAKNGTNALIADPEFKAGLQSLASRGLSFDLQLIPELMEPMGKVLAQVPDLQVVLCHAGSPYDRSPDGIAKWAAGLAQLSALPNIACKLSGLGMFDHDWSAETVRPIADVVMEQFDQIEYCLDQTSLSVRCPAHSMIWLNGIWRLFPLNIMAKCSMTTPRALFQRLSVLVTCDRAADQLTG